MIGAVNKKSFCGVAALAAVFSAGMLRAESLEARVAAAFDSAPAEHPYLLAKKSNFVRLRESAANDAAFKAGLVRLKNRADGWCGAPLPEYTLNGKRLPAMFDIFPRVVDCLLLYKIGGETKHRDEALRSVDALLAMKDWNPAHFLDTAHGAVAVSLAYDWLYGELDGERRRRMEDGLVRLALSPSFEGEKWWVKARTNWASVCHAGMMSAAFAIKDVEPELSRKTIVRAVANLGTPAAELAPDGSYPEGTLYWRFGVQFHAMAVDMLEGVLGTSFGLGELPGWRETADYLDIVTGPTGYYFNYSDGGNSSGGAGRRLDPTPAVWWFARRYARPDILVGHEFGTLTCPGSETGKFFAFALLWNSPVPEGTESRTPLAWRSRGSGQIAVQRSGLCRDAFYIGLKGGKASASHGHMDGGSFVLDAGGVRWAHDLGGQAYTEIEKRGMKLWDVSQESNRWNVFRLGTFAHNTLSINGRQQRADGFAHVVEITPGPASKAVLDLTELYAPAVSKAVRTGEMDADGARYTLADTLEGLELGDAVRWAMMTRARVVSIDGSSLALEEGGHRLVLRQKGGEWPWKVEENPRPNEWDEPNYGYRQLTFTAEAPVSGRLDIGVAFTLEKNVSEKESPNLTGCNPPNLNEP